MAPVPWQAVISWVAGIPLFPGVAAVAAVPAQPAVGVNKRDDPYFVSVGENGSESGYSASQQSVICIATV